MVRSFVVCAADVINRSGKFLGILIRWKLVRNVSSVFSTAIRSLREDNETTGDVTRTQRKLEEGLRAEGIKSETVDNFTHFEKAKVTNDLDCVKEAQLRAAMRSGNTAMDYNSGRARQST